MGNQVSNSSSNGRNSVGKQKETTHSSYGPHDILHVDSWSVETVCNWATTTLLTTNMNSSCNSASSCGSNSINNNMNLMISPSPVQQSGSSDGTNGSAPHIEDIQNRIKQYQIDGKALLCLNEDDLVKKFTISDARLQMMIMRGIRMLRDIQQKRNEKGSLSETSLIEKNEKDSLIVLHKLESLTNLQKSMETTDFSSLLNSWQSLRQLAMDLGVSEYLLNSYLSKQNTATCTTLDLLLQIYGNDTKVRKELLKAQTVAKDAIRSYWRGLETYQSEVKIKLLIVEQSSITIHKLCPLAWRMNNTYTDHSASNANPSPEPLRFIAALTIGPWYLEWNESNLAIPQKCCAKAIIYSEDIGKIMSFKDMDKALPVVARVVSDWNVSKTYNDQLCNSYHFVYELLTALDALKPVTGHMLSSFLEGIESQGSTELAFVDLHEQYVAQNSYKSPTTSYDISSPSRDRMVELATHKDVDNFLWKNLQYMESNDVCLFCVIISIFMIRDTNPIGSI